jgi:hypothetical protein
MSSRLRGPEFCGLSAVFDLFANDVLESISESCDVMSGSYQALLFHTSKLRIGRKTLETPNGKQPIFFMTCRLLTPIPNTQRTQGVTASKGNRCDQTLSCHQPKHTLGLRRLFLDPLTLRQRFTTAPTPRRHNIVIETISYQISKVPVSPPSVSKAPYRKSAIGKGCYGSFRILKRRLVGFGSLGAEVLRGGWLLEVAREDRLDEGVEDHLGTTSYCVRWV